MRTKLFVLLFALSALEADADSPIETLRDRIHAAVREAGERHPPLQGLAEAADDVEDVARRIEAHVDASVKFLNDLGPCEAAGQTPLEDLPAAAGVDDLPAELDRAFDDLEMSRKAAEKLLVPQRPAPFRESVRKAIAAADDMLARRRDSSSAARWLRRFAAERRKSDTHQELCRVLATLPPLPRPFTLAEVRRDPLVPLRRIQEAVEGDIERRTNMMQNGEWSLGLGVMWTPMKAQDGAREEVRAGQPVAMLAFRPRPEDMPLPGNFPIRPWFQIGAGLQFDEPSFYIGGAFDVGPWAHFGVGWTAQQVDDGASEEFDGSVYLALTIRLERLRAWTGGR